MHVAEPVSAERWRLSWLATGGAVFPSSRCSHSVSLCLSILYPQGFITKSLTDKKRYDAEMAA